MKRELDFSKTMFEETAGYVWFWKRQSNGGPGFFLNSSFTPGRLEAYKWAYKNYGKRGLKQARKKGLGIMRVRFVNDGWSQ